jgi:hypothetical protein
MYYRSTTVTPDLKESQIYNCSVAIKAGKRQVNFNV